MSKHTRVDGSRGSSVTVQFAQTHVAEADMPWAKKTGNNQKKDQFFMSIHGIPESWDESKESACFNLMVRIYHLFIHKRPLFALFFAETPFCKSFASPKK